MAWKTQSDFGYSIGNCQSVFSDYGTDYKRVWSKIRFSKKVKITAAQMQVGACYGYYRGGTRVSNLHGGFSGRYCIWNSNGTILYSTNSFYSNKNIGGNQINRDYVQANFSNAVLEANTDYYFGYSKDGSCQASVVVSVVNSWDAHSLLNSNNGGWGHTDIVTNGVEDYFIGIYGNIYGSANFKLNVEEVNTGIKLRANDRWNPRHGFKYNGSGWPEQFLRVYNNGWQDVSTL